MDRHPALRRLLEASDAGAALRLLGEDLPGSDATSLLLEAMRRRANALTPADVLAQYQRDRFVAPAPVDPIALARMQLQALESVQTTFEPIDLAPVMPLGAHAAVAGVDQNNVISTIRMTEVAADPTNSLALEAAVRRKALLSGDPKSAEAVGLAAVQRVVRAQQFEGPISFAHFTLLGLVLAGRDQGSGRFEIGALTQMLQAMVNVIGATCGGAISITLADFEGGFGPAMNNVAQALTQPGVTCEAGVDRQAGRGYYNSVCFKIAVTRQGETMEVGDGGVVSWTQALLNNRKERLLIGGLSLERMAL